MKPIAFILLAISTLSAFGQGHGTPDDLSLDAVDKLLTTNARQNTVGRWENSQRGQQFIAIQLSAIRDSSQRADWLTYRALGPLKHGDYDRAFADYEAAARLDPKKRGEIGWRYLFLLHDYARARDHLEAFDALTPNFDDPIDDYSVNYLKGRAYAGLGQHGQAVAAYNVAIDVRAQKHGLDWVDYRYLVARALSRLTLNQTEKALIDLDNALKNRPKSAMANFHRGRALQQLNRLAEARDAYRDALFFARSEYFERDYYYEQPDAAYPEQIEAALAALKDKP
jgi:tetratricopeptide (TPR) repeat protein